MVRVFGHADMGQCALHGQPALDQMHRCQRLHNTALLVRAGVLWPDGHDYFWLRGHNLQPLGTVLADPHHIPTSARTGNAVRFDDLFNPFQVIGQIAKVALRPFARLARRGHLDGFGLCLDLRLGDFNILERQLALIFGQLLRALAIDQLVQFFVLSSNRYLILPNLVLVNL